MENKSESLERKLDRPDWKQWLPIYGIYQIWKDSSDGKPTHREFSAIYFGNVAYQAVSISAASIGTIYGLSQLAEKLF